MGTIVNEKLVSMGSRKDIYIIIISVEIQRPNSIKIREIAG
jgi:hypothetical protein